MDPEDSISVKGRQFRIAVEQCSGSFARVLIRNNLIIMKFPKRISRHEYFRTYESFRKWAENRLMKIDLSDLEPKPKYIKFRDGQELEILWKHFRINLRKTKAARATARLHENGELFVYMPEEMESEKAASIAYLSVRKLISKAILPDFLAHVNAINARHFGFSLSSVRIRDQHTRWGSCSRSTGNINLNFRLLFAPEPVRDYVIIHELAHLKHANHSKSFWKLVESADPRFMENRKWLRANGNRIGIEEMQPVSSPQQGMHGQSSPQL